MTDLHSPHFAPPLSPDAYARCFQTFRRVSSEWRSMLHWVRDRLVRRLPRQESFAILSVGTGSGDFDFQFIRLIRAKVKDLHYVAEEPNKVFSRRLQTWVCAHHFRHVQFDLEPVPFEDLHAPGQFDLVHFSHVLYYLPDRAAALSHALELIHDDGQVLIFHQTPRGIHQLQRRFLAAVKGDDREMFSSLDLQELLDRRQIFYRLEVIPARVEVTECFQPGSAAGDDLLSFFLESDLRGVAPPRKQPILDYLREISFAEGNRTFLYHPVAVFSVYRRLPDAP